MVQKSGQKQGEEWTGFSMIQSKSMDWFLNDTDLRHERFQLLNFVILCYLRGLKTAFLRHED